MSMSFNKTKREGGRSWSRGQIISNSTVHLKAAGIGNPLCECMEDTNSTMVQ